MRAILLLLAACSPGPTSWIAPTDDPRMALGVVVDGDEVTAYACGEGSLLPASRWLSGPRGGGTRLELSDDEGWSLQLDIDRDHASGLLEGPDGSFAWTGIPAPLDSDGSAHDGLYRGEDAGCATGVLLLAETFRGTWCSAAGDFAQVEPADTLRPGPDGGLEVGVMAPQGWRQVRVYPVLSR